MPDWISAHEESIENGEELEPPSQPRIPVSIACLFIRYPLFCFSRFVSRRPLSHFFFVSVPG